MEQSASIAKLAGSIVMAQAALGPATKNSTNPHFHSKFADLSAVWDAAEKVLPECRLAILQGFEEVGGLPCLWTMLVHESGEWIKGSQRLIPTKNDPPGLASASTYARRYGLAAMLGIVQEDDDGNAASKPTQQVKTAQAEAIEERLLKDWLAAIDAVGTMGGLENVWKKIPDKFKAACTKAKNDKKAQLAEGSN